MATQDKETKIVPIIETGMVPNTANWGSSFIQNLQRVRNGWEVRPGFGVIEEYDTKLNAGRWKETSQRDTHDVGYDIGLEKHLGSHLIKNTSFGHKQVVSVWRAKVITSNMSEDAEERSIIQKRRVYVVHIYDLTTGESWEEVLHYHTSQEKSPLYARHAHYETSISWNDVWDRQAWVDAGQNEGDLSQEFQSDKDEYFYFAETSGVDRSVRLLFGNNRAGAWVYSPIDIKESSYHLRERWMQIGADATQDWREPYGESAVIIPVSLVNGDFYDAGQGLTYLTQDEFGKPQAACTLDNRVVWAVDNFLYFSDPEVPNAISEGNIEGFPARIVGVASTLGNLVVWTEDKKCYYYNPSTGAESAYISGGRITEMSSHVGISSCNAWVQVEGAIIWIDSSGIYRNYGNVNIEKISDAIEPFFIDGGLSNPLSSYYTENGNSNAVDRVPPLTFLNWNSEIEVGINAAYNARQGQIFFNIPQLNITFVIEDQKIHLWNYESIVYVGEQPRVLPPYFDLVPQVNAQKNLPYSWLLCDNTDVFMVSGISKQLWIDQTIEGGTEADPKTPPIARNIERYIRSGILLKLGRGGGLDRSLEHIKEDRRRITGEYENQDGITPVEPSSNREKGYVYIDKLKSLDKGISFNWTAGVNPAVSVANTDVSPILIPIKLIPQYITETINAGIISIKFKFDNTNWKPYIHPNNANGHLNEVVFNLPPERLGSAVAYNIGTSDQAANLGTYVLDDAGAPDANGNTIVINIDASTVAPFEWAGAPRLNLCARFKNDLMELAFHRKAGSTANVWDLGIIFEEASITMFDIDVSLGAYLTSARVWRDHTPTDNISYQPNSLMFQAVDWTYQCAPISDENVIKLRGINSIVKSSGLGVPQAGKNWDKFPIRLFNAQFSTNWKQYAGQMIDYAPTVGPKAVLSFMKGTLRDRVMGATTLAKPTWYGTATTTTVTPGEIKWGSSTNATKGNFLIGDGPQDNIRGSADVKGEGVAVQLFGHIMNYAERLRIVSTNAVLRVIGSERRKGRPS